MKPSPNAVDQDDLITSDKEVMPSGVKEVPVVAGDHRAETSDKDAPLHCERCGYSWHPQDGTPRQCALCRSAYYTRPLKITDPALKFIHQQKARERASRRRDREAKQARIKRLRRVATKLGKESVGIVQELFPVPKFEHETKPEYRLKFEGPMTKGMPPPPTFDEDE